MLAESANVRGTNLSLSAVIICYDNSTGAGLANRLRGFFGGYTAQPITISTTFEVSGSGSLLKGASLKQYCQGIVGLICGNMESVVGGGGSFD